MLIFLCIHVRQKKQHNFNYELLYPNKVEIIEQYKIILKISYYWFTDPCRLINSGNNIHFHILIICDLNIRRYQAENILARKNRQKMFIERFITEFETFGFQQFVPRGGVGMRGPAPPPYDPQMAKDFKAKQE